MAVNYKERVWAAFQRECEGDNARDLLEFLFDTGIADLNKARMAEIRYEISLKVEDGMSKSKAALELSEKHCLSVERTRGIAYLTSCPDYRLF